MQKSHLLLTNTEFWIFLGLQEKKTCEMGVLFCFVFGGA